jgi:hypothetical protein
MSSIFDFDAPSVPTGTDSLPSLSRYRSPHKKCYLVVNVASE